MSLDRSTIPLSTDVLDQAEGAPRNESLSIRWQGKMALKELRLIRMLNLIGHTCLVIWTNAVW